MLMSTALLMGWITTEYAHPHILVERNNRCICNYTVKIIFLVSFWQGNAVACPRFFVAFFCPWYLFGVETRLVYNLLLSAEKGSTAVF